MPKSSTHLSEKQCIQTFAEKAYLDYAMYVILDRALPHIADGLKPVQRRIIYAMSELGLKATAKHKKSARTVGDVLGKFHPHGDSACYEAMVLMAQSFSYRYPLIDGQGNWGTTDDPKSFAAMRYTESRLTPYTDTLLSEITQGTVDWTPNFDGTLKEPTQLPARLPNILLNGTTGIAVGMATDIPPHNLREVVHACVELLDNPNTDVSTLCQHIQGPDYPTGADIITPKSDILTLYRTGTGSIRQRACYEKNGTDIIITALPHQASGAKILAQIAQQMVAKKLPTISDLRDESDHENPTRLVIVLKSNRIEADTLMHHLFATTDLERNNRVNFNVIGLDGRPQVKNLRTLLTEWLTQRKATIRRRLQHHLDKKLSRLHILDGLLIAYLNLDAVIHLIRTEDHPKPLLMTRFNLSDIQAEAILETKLRQLARLENMKISAEQARLTQDCDALKKLLASQQRLKTLLRKELLKDAEQHGDDRRCSIVERTDAQPLSDTLLQPSEAVTVVLSKQGWVRCGKGHDVVGSALNYKAGDAFLMQAQGRSNRQAVLLDSQGRSYSLATHTLPSVRSQGEPLTKYFMPPTNTYFVAVMLAKPNQYYVFASNAGYGFISPLSAGYCKNKKGKRFLHLPSQAKVLSPCQVSDPQTDRLAILTNTSRLLVIPLTTLPQLSQGKGNKIIQLLSSKVKQTNEVVQAMVTLQLHQMLIVKSGKRQLKFKGNDINPYEGKRGSRGRLLPRGFQKASHLQVA